MAENSAPFELMRGFPIHINGQWFSIIILSGLRREIHIIKLFVDIRCSLNVHEMQYNVKGKIINENSIGLIIKYLIDTTSSSLIVLPNDIKNTNYSEGNKKIQQRSPIKGHPIIGSCTLVIHLGMLCLSVFSTQKKYMDDLYFIRFWSSMFFFFCWSCKSY